jgi:hypothetical protein
LPTLIKRNHELHSLLLASYKRIHQGQLDNESDSGWENRLRRSTNETLTSSASSNLESDSDADIQQTIAVQPQTNPADNSPTNIQNIGGAEVGETRIGSKRVIQILSEPRPNSLLAFLNLEQGDSIAAVNKIEVRDTKKFAAVVGSLRNFGEVRILFRDKRGMFLERTRNLSNLEAQIEKEKPTREKADTAASDSN